MAVTNPDFVEAIASRVVEKMAECAHDALPVPRRLMTLEQAGEYLALSKSAVRSMVANDQVPGVKQGKRTMIDIRDLDLWIERNKA